MSIFSGTKQEQCPIYEVKISVQSVSSKRHVMRTPETEEERTKTDKSTYCGTETKQLFAGGLNMKPGKQSVARENVLWFPG